MANVKVITGYVPIQDHPRTAAEYGALGEKIFVPLGLAGINCERFLGTVENTWLYKLLERAQMDNHDMVVPVAAGDNPRKNTLAYHCVQHEKFKWLVQAAVADLISDTFVWLDYGVGHVPGVEPEIVEDFINQIKRDDFAIPGCWKDPLFYIDAVPCWRFCGGVMVVPRQDIPVLFQAITKVVAGRLDDGRGVTWEVNSLAEAEKEGLISPRWYQADHNATMFTGYA
jgi:hypothetical protein